MPVERAFQTIDSRYRSVQRHVLRLVAANITGADEYPASAGGNVSVETGNSAHYPLYLDPDMLGIAGRSTKLRVVAACAVNDTAPAITMTAGLYPVGTPSGGAGILNPVLGTVVTGSTVAFASPAANSKSAETATADFDCPSAGWFCMGVATSGAMTANSVSIIEYQLQVRNV